MLTAWLNPLDAARVLPDQAHVVCRGGEALGLRPDWPAFRQFVLLQVLQHVLHAEQMGLQMGMSRASRGRGRAVNILHTHRVSSVSAAQQSSVRGNIESGAAKVDGACKAAEAEQ